MAKVTITIEDVPGGATTRMEYEPKANITDPASLTSAQQLALEIHQILREIGGEVRSMIAEKRRPGEEKGKLVDLANPNQDIEI